MDGCKPLSHSLRVLNGIRWGYSSTSQIIGYCHRHVVDPNVSGLWPIFPWGVFLLPTVRASLNQFLILFHSVLCLSSLWCNRSTMGLLALVNRLHCSRIYKCRQSVKLWRYKSWWNLVFWCTHGGASLGSDKLSKGRCKFRILKDIMTDWLVPIGWLVCPYIRFHSLQIPNRHVFRIGTVLVQYSTSMQLAACVGWRHCLRAADWRLPHWWWLMWKVGTWNVKRQGCFPTGRIVAKNSILFSIFHQFPKYLRHFVTIHHPPTRGFVLMIDKSSPIV